MLALFLQPRFFIILTTFSNLVWFFPRSKTVKEFGSEVISFCGTCAWWFDGPHVAKPFALFFASFFMAFNRWWGYVIAAVISGFYVIEGVIWLSGPKGFICNISERIEIISTSHGVEIWEFLDWQYLLASIVFMIASGYLIFSLINIKRNHSNS